MGRTRNRIVSAIFGHWEAWPLRLNKGLELRWLAVLVGTCTVIALVGCGGGGSGATGITGSVVDVATRQGVAGAAVTIDGSTYATDTNGEFRAAGLALGTVSITVTASGYDSVGPVSVTVAADTTTFDPIYITPTASGPPPPPF